MNITYMTDIFDRTIFDGAADWIVEVVRHQAYFAPFFFLLIEEMGVPLPVPGDLLIAYTGYYVSKGLIPYPFAFLLFLIAVLAGSSLLYYLSSQYGQLIVLKFGKYLHLNEEKLKLVEEKFKKYGPLVIIFGRHIPGFRIPITIFSGMSGISYKTFILSTFVSVIFWIAFYLSLGARLGPRTVHLFHSHRWYFLIALALIILLIVSYVIIVLRNKKKKNIKD